MNTYKNEDVWFQLICECYDSGMSQKDWCYRNAIPKSTFDHAVKRLKTKGYVFPHKKTKKNIAHKSDEGPEILINKGNITVTIKGVGAPALLANIINAISGSESSAEIANANNTRGTLA